MTTTRFHTVRCQSLVDSGCKKAGGYRFLMIWWLPWTSAQACRDCCKIHNPEIIQMAEKDGCRAFIEGWQD